MIRSIGPLLKTLGVVLKLNSTLNDSLLTCSRSLALGQLFPSARGFVLFDPAIVYSHPDWRSPTKVGVQGDSQNDYGLNNCEKRDITELEIWYEQDADLYTAYSSRDAWRSGPRLSRHPRMSARGKDPILLHNCSNTRSNFTVPRH